MSFTKVTVLVASSLLALSGASLELPATGDKPTQEIAHADDAVQIIKRTAHVFSGVNGDSEIPVNFTASQIAANRVDVRLAVDGMVVDVSRDLETGGHMGCWRRQSEPGGGG